jgi:DNA-binding response OmpR family regulator
VKTIVVVAENHERARTLCDLVKTALRSTDHAPVYVLPAHSIDYVFFLLDLGRIDLLLVDDHQSNMTGLDLVRWLGTALAETTRVLIIGPERTDGPERFVGTEIDAVLVRPIDRDVLTRTLDQWLGLPTSRTVEPSRLPRIGGSMNGWNG